LFIFTFSKSPYEECGHHPHELTSFATTTNNWQKPLNGY